MRPEKIAQPEDLEASGTSYHPVRERVPLYPRGYGTAQSAEADAAYSRRRLFQKISGTCRDILRRHAEEREAEGGRYEHIGHRCGNKDFEGAICRSDFVGIGQYYNCFSFCVFRGGMV